MLALLCLVLAVASCRRAGKPEAAVAQVVARSRPASPEEVRLARLSARRLGASAHAVRGLSIARSLAPSGGEAMLSASDGAAGQGLGWLATVTGESTRTQRHLPTGGPAFTTSADVATDGERAFFVWLHEVPDAQRVQVWHVAAGTSGDAEPRTVLARRWGIQALAAGFDRKNQRLCVIMGDISGHSSGSVLLAQTEWPPAPARLGPNGVVRTDERPLFRTHAGWDRSLPEVFVAGDDLLVNVNTGQRFGILSHDGKAMQGVWLVGAGPERVIGDALPVRSILGLAPGRRVVYGPGNQAGDVPVRAIRYEDAPAMP